MFEKITKGESIITQRGDKYLLQIECDGKLAAFTGSFANAEFITYCFNLQQKYDIVCLEEAVKCLESVKGLLDECISLAHHSPRIKASEKVEILINKIKKQ